MRLYAFTVTVAVFILSGCGSQEYVPPSRRQREREPQAPEEIKHMTDYSYGGNIYRDPFLRPGARRVRARPDDEIPIPDPEQLAVRGVFTSGSDKYVLLSGTVDEYLIRNGRIYDSREREVPGIAAAVREESILLFTDNDTVYEFPVPEE